MTVHHCLAHMLGISELTFEEPVCINTRMDIDPVVFPLSTGGTVR